MIRFSHVTKRFGEFVAVDDVTFEVHAGEFLTLLGPSGCGKTTILRMISGFEWPTSGAIIIDDQDMFDTPPYKRDVNQVFQSYALFPHLTVVRNIEFGLRMKRLPRIERNDRVSQAIEMLNLAGLELRRPNQLSGGQKQRVALARALVNRPKVLLLDEPLAALDAKLRRSVQLELKQLQRRLGITFVFVTHDQEEALTMSDRIAVMNRGQIQQLAPASEIYHLPANAFVAEFIGQTNLLPASVVERGDLHCIARVNETIRFVVAATTSNEFLISVRPEKVRLEPLDDRMAASVNAFAATITDRIFRGEVTQFILRCDSGRAISALITEHGSDRFDIGSRVRYAIHPEDIVLIRQ